jgi:hypothetical protein
MPMWPEALRGLREALRLGSFYRHPAWFSGDHLVGALRPLLRCL